MISIDHLIYGTSDLNKAAEKFASLGLESIHGGRHPAFGTANRIIPLGNSYIELMGVFDEAVAASNPLGSWLTESVTSGDRFLAMCVSTDDIDGLANRLGLSIVPGFREKPNGTQLAWRLAGLDMMLQSGLPFFISWDSADDHPSRDRVSNAAQALATIDWVEVSGDEKEIRNWVGGDLPLRFISPRRAPSDRTSIDSLGITIEGREMVLP